MTTQDNNRPLLDWLLAKYPDVPKKRAKQWITAGRVSVNDVIIRKPHHPLPDPGTTLKLLDRLSTTLDCGHDGWQIHPRVNLLYLDTALAIVNKGPGLLSVTAEPDDLSAQSILADFLAGKFRAFDRGLAGRTLPAAYRRLVPLPVHRLDQYTSGVFCLAMNPVARKLLIEQVSAHTMRREYVAYVEGRVQSLKGTWRNWLKLSEDELRQVIVPQSEIGKFHGNAAGSREPARGPAEMNPSAPNPESSRDSKKPDPATSAESEPVEAITHYEVIAEYAGCSKLRLRLETGRKHQIRAQAAFAGVPLIGDRTYNPRRRIDFPRQALHAEILSLEYGKPLTWTAALPPDLQELEASLRRSR